MKNCSELLCKDNKFDLFFATLTEIKIGWEKCIMRLEMKKRRITDPLMSGYINTNISYQL